ncbi:MAG TPA: UDP-N-acetylmuramoyl-L-alanine--D-glutamate ligase, partial [Planctomycetaceae bacterium]|nr:UDP-N-acetylmuramoyl-L-alanine--D-glutamate ligase [Planctomycetaceae bacterium]
LQGKRVTLMGVGTFGGGIGALRFLLDQGAHVTVTDLRPAEELGLSPSEWESCGRVTWRLGGHDQRDFHGADLVVVNPAVPTDSPYLQIARRHGVPLTTELALFWQNNRARVIAVTGTNGKSTTAAMIHAILRAAGWTAWLGGNIGRSLLTELPDIEHHHWVVLEVSSFQLEHLDRLRARPDVAVVTNFSPNHLDRHGTVDAYRCAKQALLRWQTETDVSVLNQDDPDVAGWPTAGRRVWFGLFDTGREGVFVDQDSGLAVARWAGQEHTLALGQWLALPGRHNLQNAAAAVGAARAAGVPIEAVRLGLQSFGGLPHRLQFVAEVDGRRFYNDSLATTPESAIAALQAFPPSQPIVLLAGGSDKGVDLGGFAEAIVRHAKAVALMGQTGEPLARLMDACRASPPVRRAVCSHFEQAFQWAVQRSQPGDVVLLSPGCASYDWFRSFAERGERFAELVRRLERRAARR